MKTRYHYLSILTLVTLSFTILQQFNSSPALAQDHKPKSPGVAFIRAEELKTRMAANEPVLIIDVRSSSSYANSDRKIKGAVHVKVRKLKHRLSFAPFKDVPKDRLVISYCSCSADEASVSAARVLLESGFKNVRALKGGWQEWLKVNGQTDSKPRL